MPNRGTHSCERETHEEAYAKKGQGGEGEKSEAQVDEECGNGETQASEKWEDPENLFFLNEDVS